MSKERLYLFDTTLRDGAQTTGVDFSVEEKRRIAGVLDDLGIDYIEGGYPEDSDHAVAALVGELCDRIMVWPEHNLFFGGVHAATRGADGIFAAGGDPRRGGAVAIT